MEIEEIIRKLASYFAYKKKANRVSAQEKKKKKVERRRKTNRKEGKISAKLTPPIHNDQIFKH